jgi:peptide/nickel transport system ATP-binding protein
MASKLLEVRNLHVSFGEEPAVRGVSFDIEAGETIALVGESGSGKSVTGFSIMRLVDPPGRVVEGRILHNGEDLVGLDGERMRDLRGNRIAMIFQDPMMTLNPVLRIETQMVEAVLAHNAVPKQEARGMARDALGQVGIPSPDERLRAYPHQFSGGMRQRVAIAIALLNRPDLIIADEPTTALDVTMEAQIIHLIRELQRELQATIIVVSHNLGLIAELCDEVVVMYAGEVVEAGGVREIFHRAAHPYTRALLECDPARERTRSRRLPVIPGDIPDLHHRPAGCSATGLRTPRQIDQ